MGAFVQNGSPGLYERVDVLVLTHDTHARMHVRQDVTNS